MVYGDYDGPDKPNKGKEGGACNRGRCQAEPANWYNHGSLSWYCDDCAIDIGQDKFNLREWNANYLPSYGHPMFETRAMIDARVVGQVEYKTTTREKVKAYLAADMAEIDSRPRFRKRGSIRGYVPNRGKSRGRL